MVSSILFAAAAVAFAPTSRVPAQQLSARAHAQPQPAMMAKGFGAPKPEPKPKAERPRSKAAAGRDKAAEDFEKLKAQGNPEYMVLIREVPEGQAPSNWYPFGGMAV